jgi:hypothetical protein
MAEVPEPTRAPSARMQSLDRLVGRWSLRGGSAGTTTYEWLDGGFFLLQRVELEHDGRVASGLEVIGHLRPFGAEQSEDVHSRYYDDSGNTFDYVYELDGDELTIWSGEKGSPAFYRGHFSADGNELAGAWTFPGGGGYESIATRI